MAIGLRRDCRRGRPQHVDRAGASSDVAFVATLPRYLPQAGAEQPAGVGGFDGGRDDVLEQRVLDHPLPIVFDHRLMRAAGRTDADSGGRLRSARAGLRSGSSLRAARFRAARHARAASGEKTSQADGRVLPEPGDGGQEFEPLAESLRFFFQLEFGAVGGRPSSIMSASRPSSVLSR